MKPGSIILIIIAVVLVIAGVITCLAGSNMAKKNGKELFTQYRDDMPYFMQEFGSGDITNITISVTDANINVYGNTSRASGIEIKNYPSSRYNLTVHHNTVNFEETQGIMSWWKFWENDLGTKGLRDLLSSLTSKKAVGEKEINIFISEGSPIKSITIESVNSKITVDTLDLNNDLTLKKPEDCTLEIKNSTIGSRLRIEEAEKSTVTLSKVTVGELNVKSNYLSLSAEDCSISNIDITGVKEGGVDIRNNVHKEETTNYEIVSKSGTVTVDGTPRPEGYKRPKDEITNNVRIITDSANVNYVKD